MLVKRKPMPDTFVYLAVDLGCILFPFLFSFHPRFAFYKHWRYFVLPCLAVAAFFILWDILFTHLGVWSFNSRYVCGIWFFGLPVEELLFFICVPYACTFTYYCVVRYTSLERFVTAASIANWVMAAGLAVVGLLHPGQLYTSVTFVLLAVVLIVAALRRWQFMPAFYTTFLLILLPFFISNGILTGTGIAEPVVRYNDAHNLGIRMLTIPVEDTFYGMLLLLLNVAGYEWMKRKEQPTSSSSKHTP